MKMAVLDASDAKQHASISQTRWVPVWLMQNNDTWQVFLRCMLLTIGRSQSRKTKQTNLLHDFCMWRAHCHSAMKMQVKWLGVKWPIWHEAVRIWLILSGCRLTRGQYFGLETQFDQFTGTTSCWPECERKAKQQDYLVCCKHMVMVWCNGILVGWHWHFDYASDSVTYCHSSYTMYSVLVYFSSEPLIVFASQKGNWKRLIKWQSYRHAYFYAVLPFCQGESLTAHLSEPCRFLFYFLLFCRN